MIDELETSPPNRLKIKEPVLEKMERAINEPVLEKMERAGEDGAGCQPVKHIRPCAE